MTQHYNNTLGNYNNTLAMLVNLIEKEFKYDGLDTGKGCFTFSKQTELFTLLIHIYDDHYVTAQRIYTDECVTKEYLISSVSHLIGAITDSEEWEKYVKTNTHEGLSIPELRRLYLNAPISIRKQLRQHPQYASVIRNIESTLVNKNERQLQEQVKSIAAIVESDPYRAYGEALRLVEQNGSSKMLDDLVDLAAEAKMKWDAVLSKARKLGRDKSRTEFTPDMYKRLCIALHWGQKSLGGESYPKASHYLSCEGAKLSQSILAKRVATLSSHYPDTDVEILTEIVKVCDETNTLIDLSQKLTDQFDIE